MSIKKLKRLARLKKPTKDIPFEPKKASNEDLFRPFSEIEKKKYNIENEPALRVRERRRSQPPLSQSVAWTKELKLESEPKKKSKKKPKKPGLTVALEDWFKTQVYLVYGQDIITKKWGVKERTLAKKLVEAYGKDLTESVIKSFIEQWPQMVVQSRGRLYGLPTINFLWSTQDRFFGQAQIPNQPAVSPSRLDEYREEEDEEEDGW